MVMGFSKFVFFLKYSVHRTALSAQIPGVDPFMTNVFEKCDFRNVRNIFKNGFLGKPIRSKGFFRRQGRVAWAVLTHNLWVIARLPVAEQEVRWKQAA
jgi:hypothetical protein